MSLKPFQTRFLGYWLLFLVLFLATWLNLETPLLTILFSIFALEKLRFIRRKWLAVCLFVVLVCSIFYLFAWFIKQSVDALPKLVEESVPKIVAYVESKGVKLPFEDVGQLKSQSISWVQSQLGYLGNFAKLATKEFAFLLVGLVVAVCFFLNPELDLERGLHPVRRNLYSFGCDEIAARFRAFYESFRRVMGAQIIISLLNSGLTAIYLVIIGLPYTALLVVLTFFCGLLPIIGNIIGNSVIVVVSFKESPQLAIASLTYLIVIHKFEYFLNGKIIGDRIKNPVWLTLLGLLLGERLMGIPGMILAPVILNFIKVEASRIELPGLADETEPRAQLESAAR
jgi:predicted PurR-regulated permease PerM